MRRLLVLPMAVALIGLAVPAHADPAGDDATFLAALNNAGITYSSADQAVAAGKAACEQMDNGAAAPDVVKQLTDANPGFTLNAAVKFASIAASVYCPQHLVNGGANGNGAG